MNTQQVTWKKSRPWKTTGTIKGKSWKITLTLNNEGFWSLNVLNREFPFAHPADAKVWCETADFSDKCAVLESQWSKTPAVSTQAALQAAAFGVGRGCVDAPTTFLF